MKVIAGLGNPGQRYERTRHNVGFRVIDELARRWNAEVTRFEKRFEALVGQAAVGGQRVLLLKPQTFMNLSGRSLLAVVQFYKLPLHDVLVVCDDMDLPVGRIRLRAQGTGGGQKGLENILLRLGSVDLPRLRIGIGKAPARFATQYVLGRFGPDEQETIAAVITTAADAAECWLRQGIAAAMNRYNRKPENEARNARRTARDDASEGESS